MRLFIFCLLMSAICFNVVGQDVSNCLKLRQYEQEEEIFKASLKTNIKKFGKTHDSVVQNQSNLAELYQELGQYDKAEALLENARDAAIDEYGKKHVKTAARQMELANIYVSKGQYLVAKILSEKALKTNVKSLGENDATTAESCANLAVVYQGLGQYEKAKHLLERALNTSIEIFGTNHATTIKYQSELALLCHTLGEYEEAQTLFEAVLSTDFESINEEDIDVTKYQTNLANIYFQLKKYEKARDLLESALATDLYNYCEDHPKIARHQVNLSNVYFCLGEYKKTEKLLKTALVSNLKHYDAKHPIVSKNYVDLALTYQMLGQKDDVESSLERIPGISDKSSGEKRKKILKDIAQIARFIRGDDIHNEAGFQKTHPILKALDIIIATDNNYSEFDRHRVVGDTVSHQNAKLIWAHIIANITKGIHQHCVLLPADERLMYIQKQVEIFDKFYSFGARVEDPEVFYQIMRASNSIKAIGLDYSRSLRRHVLKSKNKKLINLYDKYSFNAKLLSKAYLLTKKELEQKKWDIEVIKKETNRLEVELLKSKKIKIFSGSLRIEDFEKAYFWASLAAGTLETLVGGEEHEEDRRAPLRVSLNSTERVVDFVRFNYHNGKYFTDSMLYYALLYNQVGINLETAVTLSDGIYFIPLTDEETLRPLIEVREGDYLPAYMRSKEKRKKLYELIWRPLEPYIRGVEYVYLSPTNLLYQLDFGALEDNSGQYLNERFEFHYSTSVRSNYKQNRHTQINGKYVTKPYKGAVLIGNIAYDKGQTSQRQKDETEYDGIVVRGHTRRGIEPLPATLEEVKAIQDICQKKNIITDLLTADTPTEDTLQYLSGVSPDIIHIATHGFSLTPLYDNKNISEESLVLEDRIRYADNPLQRCGLMLYGANEAWKKNNKLIDPKKDGILTGLEVTELDLNRTRLVVLSACSTGLGSVHATEGVFGLQRAFKLAGAEQVIVSLWPVDDEITKELMILFYENLLNERQTAGTALRNAKAEMRKRNDAPYLWAGFILTE